MIHKLSSKIFSLKFSILFSLILLITSCFVFLLEYDKNQVSILKFNDHMYIFVDGHLFLHGRFKGYSQTQPTKVSFSPRLMRGTNDLLEGIGSIRATDYFSLQNIFDDHLSSFSDTILQSKNWYYSCLGYYHPKFPSPLKLNYNLPSSCWLSFDHHHPKDLTVTFANKNRFIYYHRPVFNEFKVKPGKPVFEKEPTVPNTFYLKRIFFVFTTATVIGLFLYLFYTILGYIIPGNRGKTGNVSRNTSEVSIIPENQSRELPPITSETPLHFSWSVWLQLFLIFGIVAGWTFYLNYAHLDHVPRVVDEAGYLFQAKIFASGHLSVPMPKFKDFLDFPGIGIFKSSDKVYHRGLPGHALLLVPGIWIGCPSVIPSVLQGISFVFIFLLGSYLFNKVVGWTAVLLGLTSPWITTLGASFMAHTPALCFSVMFSYFFIRYLRENTMRAAIWSGIALGAELWTRTFTGVCIGLPFLGLVISRIFFFPRKWLKFLVFLSVVLIFILGLYIYISNQGVVSGLEKNVSHSKTVIHWNSTNLMLFNYYKNLSELQISFLGWSPYITLVFFILGLIVFWKYPLIRSLGIIFFSVSLLYSWKGHYGWTYEPRYWYESVHSLLILTAAGIYSLGLVVSGGQRRFKYLIVLAYLIPLLMVFLSFSKWTPQLSRARISGFYWRQYKRFDEYCYVNDRLRDWVEENKPRNALIFVGGGPPIWRMTPIYPLMALDFKGDVIFAIDKKNAAENQKLIDMFPNRTVYWFDNHRVRPYSEYQEPHRKRKSSFSNHKKPLPSKNGNGKLEKKAEQKNKAAKGETKK